MKDRKRSKGFTLIELIAVLVILAIIALIVTPLVLNVVRKAKDSANKRSIDAYGKAIDLAVASYLLDKGDFPTSVDELTIEYSGSEVVCGIKQLNEDSSVYLSECSVGGVEVKDSNTDDGWYHYGKTSSVVYQSYKIGDIITYNGMDFYVIADSDENSDSVTMLKAEPLTVDEVNTYGKNHINKYSLVSVGVAYNYHNLGYGGIEYYSSETCGCTTPDEYDSCISTGCTTDYEKSDIKYVVDAWALDKFKTIDLNKDNFSYEIRLITFAELKSNFGYEYTIDPISNIGAYGPTEETPDWLYGDYYYWTMSTYDDTNYIWRIGPNGGIDHNSIVGGLYPGPIDLVRPVVTILKSAIK